MHLDPEPRLRSFLLLSVAGLQLSLGVATPAAAAAQELLPVPALDFEARTAGLQRHAGLVDLYWDAETGQLLLGVPEGLGDLLHYVALVEGLGSNDVGLDRGQLGVRQVVRFERTGPVVQLVAPNLAWRLERPAGDGGAGARQSFADGVLASFALLAEFEGRWLIDATEFLCSDAHALVKTLGDAGQGDFTLSREDSVVLPDGARAFEDNVVAQARLVLHSENPGAELRATSALPGRPAFVVRHGLARLPELGDYQSRANDPRAGYFGVDWTALDAPIDEPTARSAIARHRLEPGAEILYHVDRAAPEPVRSALLDGARYWSAAFEQAGLPGAFRVELLPEGADPLDLRYNVIQWVFRSTRGWSYGDSLVDPRTGEILKGHVSLGALRVRQDVLLAEGWLAPYADGVEPQAAAKAAREMALARVRQLAAHEIGHTLGLRHNFAASMSGDESVMDYPHPRVRLANGEPTVDAAYRDGPGRWDALAIRYGYGSLINPSLPKEELERGHLAATLSAMESSGIAYLSDADATAGVHPVSHRWDLGRDPVAAYVELLAVRAAALRRFGPEALRPGRPLAELELALVPLWLSHRYQAQAAASRIGGFEYSHRVRGEADSAALVPVRAADQRAALEALFSSLTPDQLVLPERIAMLLPPPPPGGMSGRERFASLSFLPDRIAASRAAAAAILDPLFDAARLTRLALLPAEFGAPTPGEVLSLVSAAVLKDPSSGPEWAAVRADLLERLMELASDPAVSASVGAAAFNVLEQRRVVRGGPLERFEQQAIERFFTEPLQQRTASSSPQLPPGPPIGSCSACNG